MLSLPVGTEMFHFPTFPPLTLCVQVRVTGHDSCRVSPFGNPRITARLTAPRGLSQPPTSFIGSWCQGIHRAPLLTWSQSLRCSRPLCSSQGTGGTDAARRVSPQQMMLRRSFDAGRCPLPEPAPPKTKRPGEPEDRGEEQTPVPSGLNSVPKQTLPVVPTSLLLRKAAVLARATRRSANWSMFHP